MSLSNTGVRFSYTGIRVNNSIGSDYDRIRCYFCMELDLSMGWLLPCDTHFLVLHGTYGLISSV